MARLQEAAGAERVAAVEKEREACQRRLAEMSAHFEEQLHAQTQALTLTLTRTLTRTLTLILTPTLTLKP